MKYSKNYKKLYNERYTTIRRYPQGHIGDIKRETYPNGKHNAEIMDIIRMTANGIPTDLLLLDTGCKTREAALNLIQSFYPKRIDRDREKLYIYFMKRINYKDE